jgi:hypothetical protein
MDPETVARVQEERARAAERAARLRAEQEAALIDRALTGPGRQSHRRRRLATGVAIVVALLGLAALGWQQLPGSTGQLPAPSSPSTLPAGTQAAAATPTTVATPAGQGAAATTSTTISLSLDVYRAGDCVTWDQSAGLSPYARPVSIVTCTSPHLVEIVGLQQITGFGSDYPGDTQLGAYTQSHCVPAAAQYLGYSLDPYGRFAANAIRPTPTGWLQGDRSMWCDLEMHGTASGPLPSFTGPVKGADQTWLFPVGTCLPPQGQGWVSESVPCTTAHVVEVTGNVDLTGKVSQLPTSETQWEATVGSACGRLAISYLGGSYPKGVESGWWDIEQSSWAAGRRVVQCVAGKTGGTGWQPVTTPLAQLPH